MTEAGMYGDLVARLRALCTSWDGHLLDGDDNPPRAVPCSDLIEAATAIETLLRERDARQEDSDSYKSAMHSFHTRALAAEAKVAKRGEALSSMMQRFELYCGPDNTHAGHHDIALLEAARLALKDTP